MSTAHEILVVFDVESEPPEPIGVWVANGDDTITYRDSHSRHHHAPADCVKVELVTVTLP